jgi:hypothetical protein
VPTADPFERLNLRGLTSQTAAREYLNKSIELAKLMARQKKSRVDSGGCGNGN